MVDFGFSLGQVRSAKSGAQLYEVELYYFMKVSNSIEGWTGEHMKSWIHIYSATTLLESDDFKSNERNRHSTGSAYKCHRKCLHKGVTVTLQLLNEHNSGDSSRVFPLVYKHGSKTSNNNP